MSAQKTALLLIVLLFAQAIAVLAEPTPPPTTTPAYLSQQVEDKARQTQLTLSKKIEQSEQALRADMNDNYMQLDKRMNEWHVNMASRIILFAGGSIFFFGGVFMFVWYSLNKNFNVGRFERRIKQLERKVYREQVERGDIKMGEKARAKVLKGMDKALEKDVPTTQPEPTKAPDRVIPLPPKPPAQDVSVPLPPEPAQTEQVEEPKGRWSKWRRGEKK